MKIKTSTITFWFNKQNDIKQYSEKFNKALESHFFPFNVFGIPATVDMLYPRMTTVSRSNHSNIEFSLINLRLNTIFDSNYEADLDSCINYLKDRALLIYRTLNNCGIDIVYSAIFIVLDEKCDSPEKSIIKKFFNNDDYKNVDEVGIRLSNTIDDKYYKILNINNNKSVKFKKIVDSNTTKEIVLPLLSLDEAEEIEDYLMTSVEVNDKLIYNRDHKHITNETDFVEMLEHIKKEIANELERF